MRKLIAITFALFAGFLTIPAAVAQDYPNKPVRLLVPFTPGGGTDTFARLAAEGVAKKWGQPIVVENRPGGNTVVATTALATAKPDGYTLGMTTSTFVINPGIRDKLPYNSLEDFVGISMIAQFPIALVVHPAHPARTVDEFVEHAKKQKDPLLIASPGVGNMTHLLSILLSQRVGFQIDPVTYNGSIEAIPDVMSGRVPVLVDSYAFLRPYIESNKVRPLAFFTEKRLPNFPDVPTLSEKFPGLAGSSQIGFLAPKGTPAEILAKISKEVQAVVNSEDFAQRAEKLGAYPSASTPEETDAILRREIAKWAEVSKAAGIKVE